MARAPAKKPAAKTGRRKLVTPPFTGSFVHLAEPHSASEDIDPCFSLLIVLDPEDPDHEAFIERVQDEIDSLIEGKWGEEPRKFQSPLKEGEDLGDSEELAGKLCINVRSKTRPGIVDADLQKILDLEEEVYSGARYVVSISGYAWEHKVGGKGVSFGLDNVMKVGEGDHLGGGRAKAEDDFADYTPPKSRGAKGKEKGTTARATRGKVETQDDDDEQPTRSRRTRR